MFVTPMPYAGSSASSSGRSRRGVKPAACSVGQKRLPGRAKWWPTSAERSDGLMPTNTTRSPGPRIGPSTPSGAQLAVADAQRAHARRAVDDADRQRGAIEPGPQPLAIARHLEPRDAGAGVAGRIADAGVAGDEERQRRLAHRLRDAREAGAQPLPRDRRDGDAEALGDRRDVVDRDGPGHEPVAGARDPLEH